MAKSLQNIYKMYILKQKILVVSYVFYTFADKTV